MYRVNFGNCQVSQRFRTKKEAAAYIAACSTLGSDPYAGSYYIERREIGSADCPGDWVRVKR